MTVKAKTRTVYRKPPVRKGNSKVQNDKDTENNPLLKIENVDKFRIEIGNIFQDQSILINPEYVNFQPSDISTIDSSNMEPSSEFLVILRYFEYVITARFNAGYILPLWTSGQKTGDISFGEIFDSVDHRLLMELQLKVPSFDEINMLEIKRLYKIKY